MPWQKADAKKHTKKAKSAKAQSQWAAIANQLLASGKSEGDAVRMANGAVKKRQK